MEGRYLERTNGRYMNRKCACGCRQKATHQGKMPGGSPMITGCETSVRTWVLTGRV